MPDRLPLPAQTSYSAQGKLAIAAAMRNEGCFVLEWVAYHLGMGFDQIFVATNDCTDGTDKLLSRLAQIMPGRIFHYDNSPAPELPLQLTQYALIRSQPEMAEIDYLAIIDADEFIVVNYGEGRVQDLLDVTGGADAIALLWKHFGDNGMKEWTHGRLLTRQTKREKKVFIPRHKTIFRPASFGHFDMHRPCLPLVQDVKVVNALGQTLSSAAFDDGKPQLYEQSHPDEWTWQGACVHHHSFRTQDLRLLKNHRGDAGDPTTTKNLRDSRWSRQSNHSDVTDLSAIAYDQRTQHYLDHFLADPELSSLQRQAEDWLDDIRAQILTPEQIWKWTHPKSPLWDDPDAPSRSILLRS